MPKRVLWGIFTLFCTVCLFAERPVIKGGNIYAGGEKFIVKGIGYEPGCRKGGLPWDHKFDKKILKHDFTLMSKAAFNTVRTWVPLTKKELKLVKKSGLYVIQGFLFDPEKYINDTEYSAQVDKDLKEMLEYSRKFDNILFYSIMNEPNPEFILKPGMENKFTEVCGKIKSVINTADPGRAVTFSNSSWTEFLDQSMWDVVFFNEYMYAPNTIKYSMGYRGHLEWLKERFAKDKPFVIGEYGLSVSPVGDGNFGYGGNTPEQQKTGCIYMYDSIISALGQGGCLYMWIDSWWKTGGENSHEGHPEEWFGVLSLENEKSGVLGEPRPVYQAFKDYNQCLVTSPRNLEVYRNEVPVEVYVSKDVKKVSWRIDNGPWSVLARASNSWWTGTIDAKGLAAGYRTLEVQTEAGPGVSPVSKSVIFRKTDKDYAKWSLTVIPDREIYMSGETLNVSIQLADEYARPVAGHEVKYAFRNHLNGEEKNFSGKTNSNGVVRFTMPLFTRPTYLTVSAGTDVNIEGINNRLSAANIIKVEPGDRAPAIESGQNPGQPLFKNGIVEKKSVMVYAGDAEFSVQNSTGIIQEGKSALLMDYRPKAVPSWGYAEMKFNAVTNISTFTAAGLWFSADNSENDIIVMLVDQDGERWFFEKTPLNWMGWKKIMIPFASLQRDPNDGVRNGNFKPDTDKMKGMAFSINSKSGNPTKLFLTAPEAYK